MNFSIGKDKKDFIRYIILLFVYITTVFLARDYGTELISLYTFLVILSIPTIKINNRFSILIDFIFPLASFLVSAYVCRCIILIKDNYFAGLGDSGFLFTLVYIMGISSIIVEFILVYTLYFLSRTFRIKPWIASFISILPSSVLILANYYVLNFRGSELSAIDFAYIKTALSVAGNYSFKIKHPYVTLVAPILFFIIAISRIKIEKNNKKQTNKQKLISSAIYLVISTIFAISMFISVNIIAETKIAYHWGLTASRANGYITNFALEIKELSISKPDGYNRSDFEGITNCPEVINPNNVNIIIIMSESYADLSIYDDLFSTYNNPAPFWSSLTTEPNTRSGYAYSSVYGGNTANSEFEVLTGLTMAGLPEGSVPYSLYINQSTYSLPAYLSELGYSTTAIHPFIANSWNRPIVYPRLCFDNYLSISDFSYTDADFARGIGVIEKSFGFLSDYVTYTNLLNFIESDNSFNPGFYFLVTIQNHGGYDIENEITTPNQLSTTIESEYNENTNVYLSNIQKSDEALEYLINELKNSDEQYVVLIFGDHQPSLPIINSIDGESGPGGIKWVVPYILWTNYNMPANLAGSNCDTTINYLSLDVLTAAGIPLSPYYEYISEIRQAIPMINASGYYSNMDNSWHALNDAENNNDDFYYLNRYYSLQYYSLFDS